MRTDHGTYILMLFYACFVICRLGSTIECYLLSLFNKFRGKFLWFNFRNFYRFFHKIRDASFISMSNGNCRLCDVLIFITKPAKS